MTAIEERANEPTTQSKLGPALTAERGMAGVRLQAFQNALLLYVPGAGVYCLPEATQARNFDPN